MLRYKPNFCCNCGEKIERLDWPFWSGRRFCELCETDYWLYDATPMLATGVIALLGILGFVGIFRAEKKADVPAVQREIAAIAALTATRSAPKPTDHATQPPSLPSLSPPGTTGSQSLLAPKTIGKPVDQQVFACGAMTKKGSACTRRVKTAGERCWQHKGMPAMESGPRH